MEISVYKCLNEFRQPLLDSIIKSLDIPLESKGMDAGCGIGFITDMLAQRIGEKGSVTGLDLSKELINYARNNNQRPGIHYIEGDINKMLFEDNSFDWIWSMDTVWPGPREFGCPAEDPFNIIKELYRVIKPGGFVYLLYWSSQKLLAGYPLLEAKLNTTSSAAAPFIRGMDPANHIMNGRYWLQRADFNDVSVKTYTGDINAPLSENDQNAINILIQMLWFSAESELDRDELEEFRDLYDPDSEDNIFNNQYYYGFYTYTLFTGRK